MADDEHTVAVMAPFPKVPTPEQYAKLFEPYGVALGNVLWSWNHLHESLGRLFAALVPAFYEQVMLGAWYSLKNDRAQRDMLLEAVERTVPAMLSLERRADVIWLVKTANSLADERNNAIHAPLVFVTSAVDGTRIKPETGYGNPRARRLHQKDIMNEFVWCHETARALQKYAFSMYFCLRFLDGSQPWPDRPQMPSRGSRETVGDRHHRIPPA